MLQRYHENESSATDFRIASDDVESEICHVRIIEHDFECDVRFYEHSPIFMKYLSAVVMRSPCDSLLARMRADPRACV